MKDAPVHYRPKTYVPLFGMNVEHYMAWLARTESEVSGWPPGKRWRRRNRQRMRDAHAAAVSQVARAYAEFQDNLMLYGENYAKPIIA